MFKYCGEKWAPGYTLGRGHSPPQNPAAQNREPKGSRAPESVSPSGGTPTAARVPGLPNWAPSKDFQGCDFSLQGKVFMEQNHNMQEGTRRRGFSKSHISLWSHKWPSAGSACLLVLLLVNH